MAFCEPCGPQSLAMSIQHNFRVKLDPVSLKMASQDHSCLWTLCPPVPDNCPTGPCLCGDPVCPRPWSLTMAPQAGPSVRLCGARIQSPSMEALIPYLLQYTACCYSPPGIPILGTFEAEQEMLKKIKSHFFCCSMIS